MTELQQLKEAFILCTYKNEGKKVITEHVGSYETRIQAEGVALQTIQVNPDLRIVIFTELVAAD